MTYRIEWPNDVRNERLKDERFASPEEALKRLRGLWTGCFELRLYADDQPGHYFASTAGDLGRSNASPRIFLCEAP